MQLTHQKAKRCYLYYCLYYTSDWFTVDSLLTDTSVKRTPRVGPCLSLLPLFDSL